MSDEKPNKDFHWKNKLEEIDSFPGEIFNKEAAWEKLHGRIQEESREKNTVWYWGAAACLLLAVLSPWFFVAKKEHELVKKNSVQKQTQLPSSHLSAKSNIDTVAALSLLSTEKKLPAFSVEKSNKIKSHVNHKITPVETVTGKTGKEEDMVQKITNNAVVPVSTTISIVAILPEKKKLKVVHINELGDPVAETPNIARFADRHTFQLKLINQEVYTSALPSANTGFNIFKTKNAP
jgi:hypothetical protein